MSLNWRLAPIEELEKESSVRLRIYESPGDSMAAMALDMLTEIIVNNARNVNTCMIVPVGPVDQYHYFAMAVNALRLDLSNVHLFNMDEYLDNDKKFIPFDDPLSFHGSMQKNLYDLLDPELAIPEENRWFPTPGQEEQLWDKMRELGGIDVCYGGIGINGHIAFNEAEDPNQVSVEEFGARPTRVLRLTREVVATNSAACLGEMPRMPRWAITLGMRECLSARRIVIHSGYSSRVYQLRRALCGGASPAFPVSYLQEHPNATILTVKDSLFPLRPYNGYLWPDNGARDSMGRSI